MGRILVADDRPEFVEMMQDILTADGHETMVCTDSVTAFGRIRRERLDLVILDIRMPSVDGFTVLDLMKSTAETEDIPVIVCSAAIKDVKDAEGALREKGVDIIYKPFDIEELLEKVNVSLGIKPILQDRTVQ